MQRCAHWKMFNKRALCVESEGPVPQLHHCVRKRHTDRKKSCRREELQLRTVRYDADLRPQLAAQDDAVADEFPQLDQRILDASQFELQAAPMRRSFAQSAQQGPELPSAVNQRCWRIRLCVVLPLRAPELLS